MLFFTNETLSLERAKTQRNWHDIYCTYYIDINLITVHAFNIFQSLVTSLWAILKWTQGTDNHWF